MGECAVTRLTCSKTAVDIIDKLKKTKTLSYNIPLGVRRKELTDMLDALLKDIKEIYCMIVNFQWTKQSLKYIHTHLKHILKVINNVQTIFVVLRSKIALVNSYSESDSDTDVLSDQDIFS